MPNNELRTETRAAANPLKTEVFVSGGEPHKSENKVNMEVKATTTVHPDDNQKTLVSLSAPESGFKVKVIGPFNGEVEVLPGTRLRDALVQLNTEDDTFGRYKYRDEEGEPVSIRSLVEKDLILTSLEKGV